MKVKCVSEFARYEHCRWLWPWMLHDAEGVKRRTKEVGWISSRASKEVRR